MTFEPTGTAASPRGHTTPAAPPDRSSATTPRGRSRGRSASAALADYRAESRYERKLDGLAGRTLDGLKPGRTLPQKELFSTHWSRSTPRPAEKRRDAFLIPSGRESKQAAPLRRCHRGISCQQKERSRSRNARAGSPQRRAAVPCRAALSRNSLCEGANSCVCGPPWRTSEDEPSQSRWSSCGGHRACAPDLRPAAAGRRHDSALRRDREAPFVEESCRGCCAHARKLREFML